MSARRALESRRVDMRRSHLVAFQRLQGIDMAIVDEAASLLATARQKQVRIDRLPINCRPRSVAEAHAVQDAVAVELGATIGGYKASAPPRQGKVQAIA